MTAAAMVMAMLMVTTTLSRAKQRTMHKTKRGRKDISLSNYEIYLSSFLGPHELPDCFFGLLPFLYCHLACVRQNVNKLCAGQYDCARPRVHRMNVIIGCTIKWINAPIFWKSITNVIKKWRFPSFYCVICARAPLKSSLGRQFSEITHHFV